MNPKYSIIVPTRNSYRCLSDCIDSILFQKYDNYEIILSDNHSSDNNYEYYKTKHNQRIKLLKPEKALSMVDHWEWALSHAKGDWLIIVGADDGLMPYFFKLADFMVTIANSIGIRVINSNRGGYFYWPGCQKLYKDNAIEFFAHGTYHINNSFNELLNALIGIKTAINIPCMYTNSLIHRSVYKNIKLKQGHFFQSVIPDMSAAAAISLTENRYLECGIPFGFIGTSRVSTSYCISSDDPDTAMNEVKLNMNSELKFNSKLGIIDTNNIKNSSAIADSFRMLLFESILQSHKLQPEIFKNIFDSKVFLNALFSKIFGELKGSHDFLINLARLKNISEMNGLSFDDVVIFNKTFTSKIENFFKLQNYFLQSQIYSNNVNIFRKTIKYTDIKSRMQLIDAWKIVDRMDKNHSIVDNFITNPIMLKSFNSND